MFILEHWASGRNDFKHGRSYKKVADSVQEQKLGKEAGKDNILQVLQII